MTTTIIQAGGASINDVSQSVSTIFRQRRSTIASKAQDIRKEITGNSKTTRFLVIHYDGKIIQVRGNTSIYDIHKVSEVDPIGI